jgi:hypothetical protein
MGSKSGYADAILRVLGLVPGQRAERYLWCEPDPGVRLLLEAYRDAGLAREAAAIIRGWAGEDPRALWERLRAEGPPRLPDGGAEAGEVARWLYDTTASIGRLAGEGGFASAQSGDGSPGNPRGPRKCGNLAAVVDDTPSTLPATVHPDARDVDPHEVARWCQITASNRLIHTAWSEAEGKWINTGNGGATFGGAAFCSPPERTAEGLDGVVGDLPAAVEVDARAVDPREVARLLYVAPVSARPDGVHIRDRHPVAGRNNLAGLGACANGAHVILGQDGGRMLDPNLRGPVPNLVTDVLALSAPFEVVGAVVGGGSVLVSGDRPGGARAVEGGADKSADPAVDAAAPAAHDELVVAVLVGATDERPIGVDGPDEAGVADLVLGGLCNGSPFNHMDTSTATISYGSDDVKLPPGVVVYIDPSYLNTTGYAADLPRADVVALARRWAAAGAVVAISEAEPIPELVAEGWHAVRIDGERVGQKRTFSKQQAEWLTMNRAPAWVPSVQQGLFG